MAHERRPTSISTPPHQTVHWVIVVLLAVIAAGLWFRPPGQPGVAAFAQNPPLAGARGVYAFTGPLGANRYGLFMLDVDQGTIWCYEIDSVGGTRKLRLIAARTWIYDRYLQDFNCAPPDFRMVQELVAQQRQPADTTDRPRSDLENEQGGTSGAGSPNKP
ncbi:MAG: hypothetical protein KKB50_18155 [Planctomycetes bacterium]|nr:hypothetical protein [Planctomycetota bacterium]